MKPPPARSIAGSRYMACGSSNNGRRATGVRCARQRILPAATTAARVLAASLLSATLCDLAAPLLRGITATWVRAKRPLATIAHAAPTNQPTGQLNQSLISLGLWSGFSLMPDPGVRVSVTVNDDYIRSLSLCSAGVIQIAEEFSPRYSILLAKTITVE